MSDLSDWVRGLAVTAFILGVVNFADPNVSPIQYQLLYSTIKLKYSPPSWLFGVVWPILYAFMSISITLWSDKPLIDQTGATWTSIWVLFVINVVLNAIWSRIFFSGIRPSGKKYLNDDPKTNIHKSYFTYAAIDAFAIFGTALAILILFCTDSPTPTTSIVLWSFYVLWTLYAFVLNIQYCVAKY